MLDEVSKKKMQRYKNSPEITHPSCMKARWPPRQISLLNFLGQNLPLVLSPLPHWFPLLFSLGTPFSSDTGMHMPQLPTSHSYSKQCSGIRHGSLSTRLSQCVPLLRGCVKMKRCLVLWKVSLRFFPENEALKMLKLNKVHVLL